MELHNPKSMLVNIKETFVSMNKNICLRTSSYKKQSLQLITPCTVPLIDHNKDIMDNLIYGYPNHIDNLFISTITKKYC